VASKWHFVSLRTREHKQYSKQFSQTTQALLWNTALFQTLEDEMSANEYITQIRKLIDRLEKTQMDAIRQAAEVMTDVIAQGGVIHAFGAGHAHLLAEEMCSRAGGLAPVNVLLDVDLMPYFGPQTALMENLEGYGAILFETYDARPGEAVLIFSYGGLVAVGVDIALAAKRKGLAVIAVTSVEWSSHLPPFHSSGKRIMDAADIVIDTVSPTGDGVVMMDGIPVGPCTLVTSAIIVNCLVTQTAANLMARGITPPIIWSANVPVPPEKREPVQRAMQQYQDATRKRVMPVKPLKDILAVSKGFTAKPW
jgi:uncharacterized phosphosugar-binding protein